MAFSIAATSFTLLVGTAVGSILNFVFGVYNRRESSSRRRRCRLCVSKEEGPRLPPGAQDPCHQPTLFRSKSMTTDPKKSLTPESICEHAKVDVDQLLQTGLADFSLRELLGLLISTAGAAERSVYLEKGTHG